MRMRHLDSAMPYHSHVKADVVVSALNHLIDDASAATRCSMTSTPRHRSVRIHRRAMPPMLTSTGCAFNSLRFGGWAEVGMDSVGSGRVWAVRARGLLRR